MNMRLFLHGFLCIVIMSICSCASLPFYREYEKNTQRYREDVLNFYENISDSYFILGYEYYELSREFAKKGDTERATYYNDKAALYYNLSKDMKNSAAEIRKFSKAK